MPPSAYSNTPSNSDSQSKSPSPNCQEDELVKNLVRQELQNSAMHKCDYLLQKSINSLKNPTLSTLNEIIIHDSNDDQVDSHKQAGPENTA